MDLQLRRSEQHRARWRRHVGSNRPSFGLASAKRPAASGIVSRCLERQLRAAALHKPQATSTLQEAKETRCSERNVCLGSVRFGSAQLSSVVPRRATSKPKAREVGAASNADVLALCWTNWPPSVLSAEQQRFGTPEMSQRD